MAWLRVRLGIVIGLVVGASFALFALILGSADVVAAGTSPGAMVTVQTGVDAAALSGATVFGDTPSSTPETVSFILRERNLPALEASVQQGVRHYLSVSQFAGTYGQTSANIAQLRGYLAKFRITTQVYGDDVDVVANGTAGEFDQALSVRQYQYHVPRVPGAHGREAIPAQNVHGATQSPKLPSSIAQYVLAIFGLTNYAPFSSQATRVDTTLTHPRAGSSDSCVELISLSNDCNTPAACADACGLDPLYAQGAGGQGQTVAIVTLAAIDPGAPEYFWQHVLKLAPSGRTVTVDNVDGGPGAPSDDGGSAETDLDVEQAGGIAADANVIVYQAPNTDTGFADSFFDAASQNIADSVSTSWGGSESYFASAITAGSEAAGYEEAFDEAFLEMAAQGQSGFGASGDLGAYDATADLGTDNLSVDTPADSPYLTAAGATTLPFTGSLTGPTGITATVAVPTQRAWGWDYLWQAAAFVSQEPVATAAESLIVGGGGGFSTIEPEPSYQRGVSGTNSFSAIPYLTPTNYQNVGGIVEPTAWKFDPSPPVIRGSGSGRALPDVSTDGDPYSGYLLYAPSFAQDGDPVLEGGFGGTSFVSPQLNGSTAVIDSFVGGRVGLWNPAIYSFATERSSPFTPLDQPGTSNDNLFYTGTPGLPYNEATGLGYPNLSRLADDFASQR